MTGRLAMTALAAGVVLAATLAPAPATADPPCGRGWRKHEYCGPTVYARPPVYVARPPVYYVPPPPVYYVPPPLVYYAPPTVVAPAPGLSIGVNIPLR